MGMLIWRGRAGAGGRRRWDGGRGRFQKEPWGPLMNRFQGWFSDRLRFRGRTRLFL